MKDSIPILVETEWLAENLDNSDIRIVDATWYLPTVERDGIENYDAGHIPGAVFWDIDAIADPQSSLPHMMPDETTFQEHMKMLGIGGDHHVIVYDNMKMMTAPRVWWTLRVFGHERVSLLNGGQNKWSAEDRPLTTDAPEISETEFRAIFNSSMIRSVDDVLANLRTSNEQILDARGAGRFDGTDPEPRPECRSGHIPGSQNLPFNDLIDPQMGTVLPIKELASRIQAAGINDARPVVTTCGSGITACVLALGLHLTGRHDVAVYDGSWTEWGGREDTPVAS
ncbi:MAG TPA: 3-mercaptopyruvate sulfurtransferase [Rhodospirillaceae bacterium]|nr:3-mercaptopyruvate sulfurtransferase [Rhodospirillaceae bacterium]|tara:strand:- start:4456 stop:5304 length:849 start_codon:yes stop_codon:yes gene_type:complete